MNARKILFTLATLFLAAGAAPFAFPEFNATQKMTEITRGLHGATIDCAPWWKDGDAGWVTCTAVGRVHDRDAEDEALFDTLRRGVIPDRPPDRWKHLAIEARCPAFVWSKERCAITAFSETGRSAEEGWY